jgi:Skp family chaperone for outer membrane proteins
MNAAFGVVGCLLAGGSVSAPAQEARIATVDTGRVLEEYAPWQEEMRRQKQGRIEFERKQRENTERKARYHELISQWQELNDKAKDKSLPKTVREQARADQERLGGEIRELERLLPRRHGRDWGTPEQMFDEQMIRRRLDIMKDVQETVRAVADKEQCGLVLDISRRSSDAGGGALLWANRSFAGCPDRVAPARIAAATPRGGEQRGVLFRRSGGRSRPAVRSRIGMARNPQSIRRRRAVQIVAERRQAGRKALRFPWPDNARRKG